MTFNTLKTTIAGLAHRKDFSNRNDFLCWYWHQIPNKQYPSQTLEDDWLNFFDFISLGELRFELMMWWCRHFSERDYSVNKADGKSGYWFKDWRGDWWFAPTDKSYQYSSIGRNFKIKEME